MCVSCTVFFYFGHVDLNMNPTAQISNLICILWRYICTPQVFNYVKLFMSYRPETMQTDRRTYRQTDQQAATDWPTDRHAHSYLPTKLRLLGYNKYFTMLYGYMCIVTCVYILVSQWSPWNPTTHSHLYPFTRSTHVPAFTQTTPTHSFISTWDTEDNITW